MAKPARSRLQQKIGGLVSTLDASTLIAGAERALQPVHASVERGLQSQNELLKHALGQAHLPIAEIFSIAHEVRGVAGTFGFSNLGLVADALARYLTACDETGLAPDLDVVLTLGRAMRLSFLADRQGGETLAILSSGAVALAAVKCAQARSAAEAQAR
jgi:chemotaxis protein histidine kinase CheA